MIHKLFIIIQSVEFVRRRTKWFLFASLYVILIGCSASGEMETSRVHGKVTLDGTAYTQGGSVIFQPVSAGKMATGTIQSDGSYELTTYSSGDGAVIGSHKISVIPKPMELDESSEGRPQTKAPPAIPKKYSNAAKSNLVYEVKAGGDNEFQIELKSK